MSDIREAARRYARTRRPEATVRAIRLAALLAVSALFVPLFAEHLPVGDPDEALEVVVPVEGLH